MAFRHPPPWLYWIVFGVPIVFGLISASDIWRTTPDDTSLLVRIAMTVGTAIAPLAGIFLVMGVFTIAMIYLGTPRKGDRMIVTGGEHEGKTVIVTRRHGLADHGCVHVRLLDDEIDTTISPYQLRKTGLWSHLL